MRHEIQHGPAFTTLTFACDQGEEVRTQPDSMIGMTPSFEVKARLGTQMKSGGSGVTKAARSFFVGESFFTAVYTAKRDKSQITLARPELGEIRHLPVDNDHRWMLTAGAFLACVGEVGFEMKWTGISGFMANRGLFFMRTVDPGDVFIASHGAIVEIDLEEGERYVLDNRNILAFTDGMVFESVTLTKSLRHAYFSGEGFVIRFTGPGKVLYQTRSRPNGGFLRSMLSVAF
jgi:uncharacterized protein (TIGR00266 family)